MDFYDVVGQVLELLQRQGRVSYRALKRHFGIDDDYLADVKEEIIEAAPVVVLLPDEPYAFGARDVNELGELPIPAAEEHRIHLIDGTLVSWYGPRIGLAIQQIRSLLTL